MKTKDEIISLFVEKGILSNKTDLVRRPFNWKTKFDNEAKQIFNEFASNYRSEAEAWFCLCRKLELPICSVCKENKVVFTGITKNGNLGYNTTCENCSANAVQNKIDKVRKTCASRTDEERRAISLKRRTTNKQLYGDENYNLFGSQSFHDNLKKKYNNRNYNNPDKRRNTCIKRYGVLTNLLIPEIHEKAEKNSWSDNCRRKRIQNCNKKYGVDSLLQIDSVKKRLQLAKKKNIHKIEIEYDCTMLGDVVRKYGQGFKSLGLEYLRIGSHVYVQNKDIPVIAKYSSEGTHTNNYTSKLEKEILSYIKSIYNGVVIENSTSIVPNENHRFFELDIYIPALKLAIDVNGIYWHSTMFKDIYYHQRKTKCCRKTGINILHIFEDDWKTNSEKCKSMLASCISKTFKNVIEKTDDYIVGDNSKPIFGEYDILKITKPEKHQIGQLVYYDCGKIFYKERRQD